MFVDSYFQVATHLFEQYELQMPLHLFLKEFFRNNKKYGSRDRKYIAELLYGVYRLGKGNFNLSLKEKFIIGSFLSSRLPILFFEKVDTRFAQKYTLSFQEKYEWLQHEFGLAIEVPFELSSGISKIEFITNLFSKPDVFIRIRKNKADIEKALSKHEIEFNAISTECISVSNAVKLDEILQAEDYVIQDYASQQAGTYFHPISNHNWWDVCCASGGKSIMLLDKNRNIDLTVTDVRPTIIKNLHQRFQVYGYISQYVSHVLDASQDVSHVVKKKMDGIICDVPCSGSGTWARSPEQFYFFNEEKLNEFVLLQQAILTNAFQQLKPTGKLYYITCSVFALENEVSLFETCKSLSAQSKTSSLLNAWNKQGDCLFISEIEFA